MLPNASAPVLRNPSRKRRAGPIQAADHVPPVNKRPKKYRGKHEISESEDDNQDGSTHASDSELSSAGEYSGSDCKEWKWITTKNIDYNPKCLRK